MSEDEIADYSQTLLDFSASKRIITVCPVAFGETGVKQRIKNALNYKKPAVIIITAAVIVSIIAAVCFLTDPFEKQEYNENIDSLLDKAVSDVILENNKDGFYNEEFISEGHIVMGTEENNGTLKAYVLEEVNSYCFINGYFTDNGGFLDGVVMTFEHSGSEYIYKNTDHTQDGGLLKDSVKRLFPKEYQDRVISISYDDRNYMNRMCSDRAEEYLKSIGRTAQVKDYADIDFTLLTDAGVSVEVSNELTQNEYPDYIGNYEKLENGVRFVYKTEYLKNENIIIYIKQDYQSGNIAALSAIDGSTGEVKVTHSGDLFKNGYTDSINYDYDGDGSKDLCTIKEDEYTNAYNLIFTAENTASGNTIQQKRISHESLNCFFYPGDKLYIIEIGQGGLNVYVPAEIR